MPRIVKCITQRRNGSQVEKGSTRWPVWATRKEGFRWRDGVSSRSPGGILLIYVEGSGYGRLEARHTRLSEAFEMWAVDEKMVWFRLPHSGNGVGCRFVKKCKE